MLEAGGSAEPTGELAGQIARGDRSAEVLMVERYFRPLRFLAGRRLADPGDADDVVQECFRIGIEQLRANQLRNQDALASFLRGIVTKLCLTWQRGRHLELSTAHSNTTATNAVDGINQGPLEALSADRIRQTVRALISEMRMQRDRELLWGYYVNDRDKQSLCMELGLSQEHFDRVLHRARRRFRVLAQRAHATLGDVQ